jgi:hypothetical protein
VVKVNFYGRDGSAPSPYPLMHPIWRTMAGAERSGAEGRERRSGCGFGMMLCCVGHVLMDWRGKGVDLESWCEGDVFDLILVPVYSSALLTYRPANFLLHEESGLMSMRGRRHDQSFEVCRFLVRTSHGCSLPGPSRSRSNLCKP